MAPTRTLSASGLRRMLGSPRGDGPAYAWLASGIRNLVANGRVLHGTTLPSERELTAALGLSRTTVSRAYAELRDRGFAAARRGSGTVVQVPGGPAAGGSEPLPLGGFGLGDGSTAVDLTCAAPAAPEGLADVFQAALDRLPAYIGGMGYFLLGLPGLREAIAERYTQRGAATSPDQIIVTSGALAGVAAIIRAALRPARGCSPKARPTRTRWSRCATTGRAWRRCRSAPRGRTWTRSPARWTPSARPPCCACPTSTTPRERWWTTPAANAGHANSPSAGPSGSWTRPPRNCGGTGPRNVADGGVLRHRGERGSASKSHWGGLRLGWIRAPHALVGGLARVRMTLDLGAPVLEQLVLEDLLRARPGLHPQARAAGRANRDWLHSTLTAALPGWRAEVPAGGLSLWWNLPAPRSTALAAAAARHGVLLAPGSAFAVEDHGLEHWIRTPFALPRTELERAVPGMVAACVRGLAVAAARAHTSPTHLSRLRPIAF